MKKITLLVLFGLFMLNSCSSDSSSEPEPEPEPQEVLPELTTQDPQYNAGNIKLRGTINSEGDGYIERGFCWSMNANPVYNDNHIETDGSGTGVFFYETSLGFSFDLNTTYNVRAYAMSIYGDIVYGNNITFTTPDTYFLTTAPVVDIFSRSATLSGSIGSNDIFTQNVPHKGFCVSTSATPTINNSTVVEIGTNALGDFTDEVTNLNINTTYYVRSFGYQTTADVAYGDVQSFHTTGFIGTSGGYVFYDKGASSNGWRFLEAAPADMTYNASPLIEWGCSGTSVLQTSMEIGTGQENTNLILAACTANNCAAKICANYTINGVSDWFLPSAYEMSAMDYSLTGLVVLGTETNQVHWTSSEYNATTARVMNTHLGFMPGFGVSKNNDNLVRPVRRY